MSVDANSQIYTNLQDLVRLRYTAGGFSYLPRQPIRSQLAGTQALQTARPRPGF